MSLSPQQRRIVAFLNPSAGTVQKLGAETLKVQQEVIKDLINRRLADDGDLRFEVADVAISDVDSDRPRHGTRA